MSVNEVGTYCSIGSSEVIMMMEGQVWCVTSRVCSALLRWALSVCFRSWWQY